MASWLMDCMLTVNMLLEIRSERVLSGYPVDGEHDVGPHVEGELDDGLHVDGEHVVGVSLGASVVGVWLGILRNV
eukprot:1110599-Amorphochlora_amoeboformis.AAC.1